MILKITRRRQVTLPARLLEALGVGPGDRLQLQELSDGFLLRPHRIDPSGLAPLRSKLRKGRGKFELAAFRDEPHDPSLGD